MILKVLKLISSVANDQWDLVREVILILPLVYVDLGNFKG
jgi:hypothetical protein